MSGSNGKRGWASLSLGLEQRGRTIDVILKKKAVPLWPHGWNQLTHFCWEERKKKWEFQFSKQRLFFFKKMFDYFLLLSDQFSCLFGGRILVSEVCGWPKRPKQFPFLGEVVDAQWLCNLPLPPIPLSFMSYSLPLLSSQWLGLPIGHHLKKRRSIAMGDRDTFHDCMWGL